MANAFRIQNGLQLDFVPAGAGGTDLFLLMPSAGGVVTSLASIPASRVSAAGNVTELTSNILTIAGGTGAVLTSGLTILVKLAATAQSGYLSSTDWNTFNNKLSTTLASGTLLVGSSGNVATARTISGDITISNTGVAAIAAGVIVNADINASAAIAFSKMAALSFNLVTATNGSGAITTVTGFTTTIAGYLTNITSDVQAQFTTAKLRIVDIQTSAIVRTPTAVQDGYAIVWDNAGAQWTLGPVGAGGSVTGPGSSTDNAITRWNGTGGTGIQNSGVIIDDTDNITGVTSITIGTAGLHLLDTNASHDLIFTVGTNLTADRTLTVTTGDADRTITLSGNPTLSDWFDQNVKTTGTPLFADVTVSNASGLHILDSDSSHDLILRTTSNLTADRELIFVTGDATRTLTVNASGTIYVTGGTDVGVADGGTGLSTIAALSIWVANSADVITTVTPGAGNSIRVNAGGTAWEAYTPGSGGISGLTTGTIPKAASATTLSDSIIIEDTSRIGIGGTPTAKLDVFLGSLSAVKIGADGSAGTVRTNSVAKWSGIVTPHYTSATEESVTLIAGIMGTTTNQVLLGGGDASMNAATVVAFYTASNSTTVGGTKRFEINKDGNIGLGAIPTYDTGVGVFALQNATTPPAGGDADMTIMYAADIIAGNSAPHFMTENGAIIKLYRDTGWTLPTGTPSKAGFATSTATLTQVAETLKAVMDHLMTNTGFFGA